MLSILQDATERVYLCCLTPRVECMLKTMRQAAEANRACNRLLLSTNKTKELGGNSMGLENALRQAVKHLCTVDEIHSA